MKKAEMTEVNNVINWTLREIRKNVVNEKEVRDLVNTYYDTQAQRIIIENRIRALKDSDVEVSPYLEVTALRYRENEDFIKKVLQVYVENDPIGKWLLSIMGIGPVIAAGLLSYIDISKCKTAGNIWSYAGITGTEVKKKGEKINYSPAFKTLCWKAGQSFIKVHNNPKDYYGHLYQEKKEFYMKKNEEGGFADRAREELETKKIAKTSPLYKTYSEGKLTPAHIDAMASRFAVKIFLSHLFEIWYEYANNEKPPKPFVEAHLDHVHIFHAPNREIVFGKEE